MSKSRTRERKTQPARAEVPLRLPALLVAVALMADGVLCWVKWQHAHVAPSGLPTDVAKATNHLASAITGQPTFDKLKGQWRRTDGGYFLDIRSIEPGGRMDAAYVNPRPIHVEKAAAFQEGAATKVFVELRDVNYPGSTYTLAYEAASDQLTGIFYQAAIQQMFDVVFERTK